jgi:nocturnin
MKLLSLLFLPFLWKHVKNFGGVITKGNYIYDMKANYLNIKLNETGFADSIQLPKARKFVPVPSSSKNLGANMDYFGDIRVLQFNMLADGLCGLRADLGAFSRATLNDVIWERRKTQLLHEILQYDPDVITLQECDHYYDFFSPELSHRGYDGLFAPKPASACLEVSENSDGCAIFIRRKKLRFLSSETLTFAFSKASLDDSFTIDDDKQIKAQNQVALITLCELVTDKNDDNDSKLYIKAPPIIIATTHLKAAKNNIGEKIRYLEICQLLASLDNVVNSMRSHKSQAPIVILTGDLNAAPTNSSTGYSSLTYTAIKDHHLGLRSVLNDDLSSFQTRHNLWTTWKARKKSGKENVVKHCIDYIMYTPPSETRPGAKSSAILQLFAADEISEQLLPSSCYPSDHVAIAADLSILGPKK